MVVSNICGRIFSGREKRLGTRAGYELPTPPTELSRTGSNGLDKLDKLDRIEWDWNQGWQ